MIGPCYIGLDDSDVSRHKGSLNPRLCPGSQRECKLESAKECKPGIGKIVAFHGKCGLILDQIGVFIAIDGDQDVCT